MRLNSGSFARYLRACVAAACIVGAAMPAHGAGAPAPAGTIGNITIIGSGSGAPGAWDFRVYLTGSPVICNGQTWAYINSTDANYAAITANLMEARALGAVVQLYWVQTSDGYCQIAWMQW
jgi:hypothetical protein